MILSFTATTTILFIVDVLHFTSQQPPTRNQTTNQPNWMVEWVEEN
jgi:hypothetical protein